MDRGLEGLLRTGGGLNQPPLKIFRNISAVAMKIGTRVAVHKRNTTVVFFFSKWLPFFDDVIEKNKFWEKNNIFKNLFLEEVVKIIVFCFNFLQDKTLKINISSGFFTKKSPSWCFLT